MSECLVVVMVVIVGDGEVSLKARESDGFDGINMYSIYLYIQPTRTLESTSGGGIAWVADDSIVTGVRTNQANPGHPRPPARLLMTAMIHRE